LGEKSGPPVCVEAATSPLIRKGRMVESIPEKTAATNV